MSQSIDTFDSDSDGISEREQEQLELSIDDTTPASKSTSSPTTKDSMSEPMKVFYENLNKYFEMKSSYEKKYETKKNSILKSKILTRKEKIQKIRNIKLQCINCKREVGTVFELKDRIYRAYCGDTTKPCQLNIELKRPNTVNIYHEHAKNNEDIETKQNDMVIAKLQLLFGFVSEDTMLDLYQAIKTQYNESIQFHDLLSSFIESIEKRDEKKTIRQEARREYYQAISELKKMVRQFLVTQNGSLLKDAIELYMDSIKPSQRRIRDTTYSVFHVEKEEQKEQEILLIKKEMSILEKEYFLEEPETLSFVSRNR